MSEQGIVRSHSFDFDGWCEHCKQYDCDIIAALEATIATLQQQVRDLEAKASLAELAREYMGKAVPARVYRTNSEAQFIAWIQAYDALTSPDTGSKQLPNYVHEVQYLIDFMDKMGILPEHYFTFPDGETWWAKNDTGSEEGA